MMEKKHPKNPPRILILSDWNRVNPEQGLAEAVFTGKTVVAVNIPDDRTEFPETGDDRLIIDHEQYRGIGEAVRAVSFHAESVGATHIVFSGPGVRAKRHHFLEMESGILHDPEAVIVCKPVSENENPGIIHRIRKSTASFCFRLQTGKSLFDPTFQFLACPLWVLSHLKLRGKDDFFFTELLVKAAWAGVRFREVSLHKIRTESDVQTGGTHLFLRTLKSIILNIHFTMRSVTPIPHRKIVASEENGSEKISVFRPLRSIKTLLTENVTPKQLGYAVAIGVFLGTLPLLFCHSIIILLAASFFRVNKVTALSASQLCMPPIVPAICIEAGYFLRNGTFLTEISVTTLGYQAVDRLLEWALGSLIVAPLAAFFAGGIVFAISKAVSRKMAVSVDLKR